MEVAQNKMKEKYYKENETMEERLAKRPEHIPENEFIDLMNFWDSETAKERMKALKTLEDGSNQTDPYYDVITKKEHSGRLRMYGLGVTKSSLKSKDPKTPYKIPSVFLDSITQQMEKTVAEQVEQKLSYIISKIREANQGRDVLIPDFPTSQENASSSNANSTRDLVDEFEGTEAM